MPASPSGGFPAQGAGFDVGICRETKNRWERRAPLTPDQVGRLGRDAGLSFAVQPCPIRIFPDDAYRSAGATVTNDLSKCRVVLGVKEMPLTFFRPGGSYTFFAHVIKGQAYNMPMLKRLQELGCDLADYELIKDERGRRLVFFGRFAGIAGMAETLVGLSRRLATRGIASPLAGLRPPHEYRDVRGLLEAAGAVGHRIRREGLPRSLAPLVIGVAGYGHVGQGALELLDALGSVRVEPGELAALFSGLRPPGLCHVVFREEHMVEPLESGRRFELDEYYSRPESFRPVFDLHLPYLTVLVNCIFWSARYPRLVTRDWLRSESAKPDGPRLLVIGDISCDLRGAVEATVKLTSPDEPFFVYDPATDSATDGVEGEGVVVMAIDNLPCELPADSSAEFGEALSRFVPGLAGAAGLPDRADLSVIPGTAGAFGPGSRAGGPGEIERPAPPCGGFPAQSAVAQSFILRRGKLTPGYRYLAEYLA